MTLIFAIVFFILAKFGFPIITKMVRGRQDRINDSIRLAKEAEQRVRDLSDEQARMIEEARRQQASILKEAAKARDEVVSAARVQAQAQADKILKDAKAQIATEREAALRDIRREAAMLSVSVAEKILRRDLSSDEAQHALISRMMDEIESKDTLHN